MNEINKEATKQEIIDLEEKLDFYIKIGEQIEKEAQRIDSNIKTLKIMAFKPNKNKAKQIFSKLIEV